MCWAVDQPLPQTPCNAMTNADGQLLRRWSIGYVPSMGDDQPVREWCCYASNSFEARVIAVQDCEIIRAYPSLVKYIVSEELSHV